MYFPGAPGSLVGAGNPARGDNVPGGVPGHPPNGLPQAGMAGGIMGFPGLPGGFGPNGAAPHMASLPPPGGMGAVPPLTAMELRELGPPFGGPGSLLPGGALLGLGGPYSMFPIGGPAPPRVLPGTIPVPGAEPPPRGPGAGAFQGAGKAGGPGAEGEERAVERGKRAGTGPLAMGVGGPQGEVGRGGGGGGGGAMLPVAEAEGAAAAAAAAGAGAANVASNPGGVYVCGKVVKNNEVTKVVSPYSTGHLPCPYGCGRTFKHASQRIIHVRKAHTGERPFKCKFEGCEKAFYSSGDLRAHMRTHSGERPYKCHICPKSFRTRNALKTHVKSLHTLERPFKCPEPGCGVTYMTKMDLERHLLRCRARQQKETQKQEAAEIKTLQRRVKKAEKKSLELAGRLKTRVVGGAAAAAASKDPPRRVAPAGRLVALSSLEEAPERAVAFFLPNEKHKDLNLSEFVVVRRSRLTGVKKKAGATASAAAAAAAAAAGRGGGDAGKKRARVAGAAGTEADGDADLDGAAPSITGERSGSDAQKRPRNGAASQLPRKRSVESALKEAYDLDKPPVTYQTWKRALTEDQIAGFVGLEASRGPDDASGDLTVAPPALRDGVGYGACSAGGASGDPAGGLVDNT